MVESYQEVNEEVVAPRPQRWSKAALAVGAASALLLVGFAAGSRFWTSQNFSKEVAPIGLGEIQVIPPRQECTKIGPRWKRGPVFNCMDTKCCKRSGFTCYELHEGYAKCLKKCVTGVDGTCLEHLPPKTPSKKSQVTYSQNTLFCWEFYMDDTGTTVKNPELDIMRTQLFLGASIFGCEAYRVYSDVRTWIAPDKVYTTKVEDVNGDFHFAKRKKAGTWVNSNMHIAAWKLIKDEGAWDKYDWTIKSDIDAIFIPIRLRNKLGQVEVTDNGIYLENCKWEYYGFFGALEVISHDGVGTLINNLDDCKASLNYKEGQKSTGNQPWGEDLFVQRCMDLQGVDKVAAYDISTDAACQAYRPKDQRKNTKWKPDCATTKTAGIHHFKKPADYFECLKATQR
jgi:hypothetical protein